MVTAAKLATLSMLRAKSCRAPKAERLGLASAQKGTPAVGASDLE